MFSYSEPTILSAIPLDEIKAYLLELGGKETPGPIYEYAGLAIEITPYSDASLPNLGIPRHRIYVRGDRALAEQFLTGFRFRFLSAGG